MSKYKVISMFSGCGGKDLGFERAGFKIVWANDIDNSACDTYEKNIGEIDRRDIHDIDVKEIPDADVLVAGFPCQAFSNAGNRKGVEDERGTLYKECLRVILDKRPKAVVFENVRGILSIKAKNGKLLIDEIKDILESKKYGYSVTWKLVNASDYGVPQNRLRVFIVGIDKKYKTKYIFPRAIEKTDELKLKNILNIPSNAKNQEHKEFTSQIMRFIHFIKEGGSWKDIPYEMLPSKLKRIRDNIKEYRSPNFYRRFSRNEICGTITATATPENCGIIHPTENRRYTLRECARIQSFPDSFVFYPSVVSAGYRIIGNAVPPNLAFHIAKNLKELLKNPKAYRNKHGVEDLTAMQKFIGKAAGRAKGRQVAASGQTVLI